MLRAPAPERFFRFVNFTDTCWLWTGWVSKSGYGAAFWAGKGHVRAHRWIYEFCVGPIPEGLSVDHLCRVTNCVNPGHLEVVTTRENIMRGTSFSSINAQKTACPDGHPYDEVDAEGFRRCRECRISKQKIYKARKRLADKAGGVSIRETLVDTNREDSYGSSAPLALPVSSMPGASE